MAIDSRYYIHDLDKKALKALKMIPGFDQVLKFGMKHWNEKNIRIWNMSSNLRISANQLSKYHDMLLPICEKLGIDEPEMYVSLDLAPNAYTMGDTKPCIVLTSGLLERFSDDLVKNVIAHECGHIACHHVLYSTMGNILLNGAIQMSDGSLVVSLPLLLGFQKWMRCSELSADRAAVICDGKADNTILTCMHFSGYDSSFTEEANVEEFLSQAQEYESLTKDSLINKGREFYQFGLNSHPLNALRALEAKKWASDDVFMKINAYLNTSEDSFMIPVPFSSKQLVGKDYKFVEESLRKVGFKQVDSFDVPSKSHKKSGTVLEISIDGIKSFSDLAWFNSDSIISIRYIN